MAISDYFIRYLERRDLLTDKDRTRLERIETTVRAFAPGETIIQRGEPETRSCLMLEGMSARSHRINGRETDRVITALHVPGDFVDLHGFILAGLEHSVVSIGPFEGRVRQPYRTDRDHRKFPASGAAFVDVDAD